MTHAKAAIDLIPARPAGNLASGAGFQTGTPGPARQHQTWRLKPMARIVTFTEQDSGKPCVAMRLDDPSFAEPVRAAFFTNAEDGSGITVWTR